MLDTKVLPVSTNPCDYENNFRALIKASYVKAIEDDRSDIQKAMQNVSDELNGASQCAPSNSHPVQKDNSVTVSS